MYKYNDDSLNGGYHKYNIVALEFLVIGAMCQCPLRCNQSCCVRVSMCVCAAFGRRDFRHGHTAAINTPDTCDNIRRVLPLRPRAQPRAALTNNVFILLLR